jgi:hypothetical protein
MVRVAGARLAGGTPLRDDRHFVQYRDAGAPFGYDDPQIAPSDSALSLYLAPSPRRTT